MFSRVVESIYMCLWLGFQLLFMLSSEVFEWIVVIWSQISQRLWSCWPTYSTAGDCAQIVKHSLGLKKHPRHVGFLITPEVADGGHLGIFEKVKYLQSRTRREMGSRQAGGNRFDLPALAKLITWTWAANIHVISLYDYHGDIKKVYEELMSFIQDEMSHNLWAVQKSRAASEIPKLLFHNVPKGNENLNNNGLNGFKSAETLHIFLFSYEDGKPSVIEIAKSICEKNMKRGNDETGSSPIVIKEAELDLHVNHLQNAFAQNAAEPDILLISGNVKSTLGFLPWNIRLSEIFWIPKLPMVESSHFINVLESFAGCQQRFGT